MNLDDRLSRAKQQYDAIRIDSTAIEQRVFRHMEREWKGHTRVRFRRLLVGGVTLFAALSIVVGLAPSARANALLSVEQISSKIFSLNYTHPINGYVIIDGRKLTREQYKMLFAKAVWTKDGYKVTMQKHVRLEVQNGGSKAYPTLQKAMRAAGFTISAPTFTPNNAKKVQYYASDSSVSILYQYSDNRQIYLMVFQSYSMGAEGLDNVHKVEIDNRWATLGETPQLYDAKDGTIQAKANYVLNYLDGHGLQYRIAGEGFSKADLIHMMKSVPTP